MTSGRFREGGVSASDWIEVAEAAEDLAVSPRQVRRLVEAGVLPARRLRSRWLVWGEAVRDRARGATSPGRPVSAGMAWMLLGVVDRALTRAAGGGADSAAGVDLSGVADRQVRYRIRRSLAQAPTAEQWRRWLRRRARLRRVWVHPGVLDRLAEDPRLRPGGGFAAAARGLGIAAAPPNRFYVASDDVAGVLRDYRAHDDPNGTVELMIVPAEGSAPLLLPPGEPVPVAVALADMLDSRDARERHAAEAAFVAVATRAAAGQRR